MSATLKIRILRGDLGQSKSAKSRTYSCTFIDGYEFFRVSIRVDGQSARYLMQEELSDCPFDLHIRRFIFAKQSPVDPQELGICEVVNAAPGTFRCSCIGDVTRGAPGACKHADTVRHLLENFPQIIVEMGKIQSAANHKDV